jgi:hypothetical protein
VSLLGWTARPSALAGAEKLAILEIPMAFFRNPLRTVRTTVSNNECLAVLFVLTG